MNRTFMYYFLFSLKFLYMSYFLEKCKNGFVPISQLRKGGWSYTRDFTVLFEKDICIVNTRTSSRVVVIFFLLPFQICTQNPHPHSTWGEVSRSGSLEKGLINF